MKRRFVRTVLAALAVAAALSAAGTAEAQELQLTGPLKGAPAVRHLRLYRQGRFEIAPTVSFSLLDEYRRTILVGRARSTTTSPTGSRSASGALRASSARRRTWPTRSTRPSPRDPLTATNVNHSGNPSGQAPGVPPASFDDQTAKISYVIAPQATFTPFRGKLAIFNKIFVDTDFYLAGGVAFVGIQERDDCGSAAGRRPRAATRPRSLCSRRPRSRRPSALGLLLPEQLRLVRRRVPRAALLVEPLRVRLARLRTERQLPGREDQQRRRDVQVQPARHGRPGLLVPDRRRRSASRRGPCERARREVDATPERERRGTAASASLRFARRRRSPSAS